MATKKKKAAAKQKKQTHKLAPAVATLLGVTGDELAAFLPADAPKWLRAVLWCQFEADTSLDALEAHFRDRFDVERIVAPRFPEGGPADGVQVPQLILRIGKLAVVFFYGMRGERYVEDGSWQCEMSFRSEGEAWGSNRAIYERFKALELPRLGARNVTERTE